MQLHRASHQIAETGLGLVVIGNGAPSFVAGFRQRSGYGGPVYTDPDLRAYRALQLRRSVRSNLNLRSIVRAVDAYRRGHRQRRTQGDRWQQGGVFVVSRRGTLVYGHRSAYAGDHPPIAEVIAAARRAAGLA